MNAKDILFYADRDLIKQFEKVPGKAWEIPGVCGVWSTKDVLSHLTSYEIVLAEVIMSLQTHSIPTPYIDQIKLSYPGFNNEQVTTRENTPPQEILKEYTAAHKTIMKSIEALPKNMFLKEGIATWYGKAYCLDDIIVYLNYGHKKEHLAQVEVFISEFLSKK